VTINFSRLMEKSQINHCTTLRERGVRRHGSCNRYAWVSDREVGSERLPLEHLGTAAAGYRK
jgi:hypothetical protein